MNDVRSSIQLVAKRTGLSAHVIRMWEKRYDAVLPDRTGTKRRLYSEKDIERLGLLRAATTAGHRIGDIANLSSDQLRQLVSSAPTSATPASSAPSSAEDAIAAALAATRALDGPGLEHVFEQGTVRFGTHGFLQNVIAPLATRVGDLWHSGELTAAQEHFATAAIRSFLHRRFRSFAETDAAPLLVIVTPAGQHHEIGALIVSAAARDVGWRVVYLGVSLPAAEIASAAIARRARAVALSIVYPGDDVALHDELTYLRKLLPADIAIVAGGRAVTDYAATLDAIGAARVADLTGFYRFLEQVRALPPRAASS